MPEYDMDHPSVGLVLEQLAELGLSGEGFAQLNRVIRLQLTPTRDALFETYGEARGSRILKLSLETITQVIQDRIDAKEI